MHRPGSILALVAAATMSAACPRAMRLVAHQPLYDLLVSNRNSHSVKRFDGQTGEYVDDLVAAHAGGLTETQEVLLGPGGNLIVSGLGNAAILTFDRRTGEFLGDFTSGYALDQPTKMTWGPDGNLYVSQWGASHTTVAVFDSDGAFIREATPSLSNPMQQAWDAGGTLYVATFDSRDVRRFDPSGALIDVFVDDDRLEGPVNLFFDDRGDLLILDWRSRSIQHYSGTDGSFIDFFTTDVNRPEGWTIGPDGLLYVSEWEGNTVKRFDPDTGASLGIFAQAGGLSAPNSVLFVERLPDFSLTLATDRLELSRGQTGSLELTVDPVRGLPFTDDVQIECTSSVSAVTCTPEPATLVPGDAGGTVTLTVRSVGSASTSLGGPLGGALLAGATGLVLLLWCAEPRARWSRWPAWGVVAVSLILVASCGGSSTGPSPPGPGPGSTVVGRLDITATSGDLSRTVTATVAVR